MSVDIRRIQKTGASTMTVSLPKDWIDSQGLKAGDPVGMQMMPDGTVNVDPRSDRKKEPTKKTIRIEKEESEEHLTRKLIGAYLAGFNIIEVRSKDRIDHDIKHAIKDFARLVIGPEVIEETSNSVVLHDLSDPVELPQEKCVRRMHLIVNSMHKDAMEAFREGDVDMAHDIIDRDGDVDRLYWMAVKQYNLIIKDRKLGERIGVDIYEGMNLMLVARGIERIGDHAEKIAKNVIIASETNVKMDGLGTILELSAKALDVLDRSIEAFFLKDIGSANAAIDAGNILVQNLERLSTQIRMPTDKAAIVATNVIDSIIRTTMYSMDISEIAINGAMNKKE
ncbi:MAG: phosphate uptake regulator PhoU [Methanomassiliicoccales archaeon]|jgi:phosphate uptake regulator